MPKRNEVLRIVDPVLTTIARGYSNSEFIGDKLFPRVPVEKEGGKIPTFGKENFRVYETLRGLRADSNQKQSMGIGTVAYATEEHDLEERLDYRELKEAMFPLEKLATKSVSEALALEHEKAVADLAQDLNTYPADNKVTLTTTQFNDTDVDPVAVVDQYKNELRAIIGKKPNAMFMGSVVMEHLRTNPQILEKIKYSALGLATEDILKQLFGIPNIFVGEAIWSADGNSFADIWGDNVILAYITSPSGMANSPYEPCFGYTLQMKGNPFVDKRMESGNKIEVVRATDNYDIKVVGSESAFLIKDVLG